VGCHAILQKSGDIKASLGIRKLEQTTHVFVTVMKKRFKAWRIKTAHFAKVTAKVSVDEEIAKDRRSTLQVRNSEPRLNETKMSTSERGKTI